MLLRGKKRDYFFCPPRAHKSHGKKEEEKEKEEKID